MHGDRLQIIPPYYEKLTINSCRSVQKVSFSIMQPQRQTTYLLSYAPSDDSDQPAQARNLIRLFTRCNLNSQWCKVSSCGRRSDQTVCQTIRFLVVQWDANHPASFAPSDQDLLPSGHMMFDLCVINQVISYICIGRVTGLRSTVMVLSRRPQDIPAVLGSVTRPVRNCLINDSFTD